MTRLWQPREARLLSEWVAEKHPHDTVIYRARLGAYPEWAKIAISKGAPPEIYKIYQRWADAIIITTKELIIVEAKIISNPGVISQIQLYMQLIPKTPELVQYKNLHIRPLILMAMHDPEVEELATSQGIEIQVYTPPWVIDYLKEIKKYREAHKP